MGKGSLGALGSDLRHLPAIYLNPPIKQPQRHGSCTDSAQGGQPVSHIPHIPFTLQLTRQSGGRAEFKWEDVKNDAQRENYLGHSLMAPVGRWQQGRDLNWYAKGDAESKEAEAARIKEEKRKLKEAEEDAMLAAMGLPVPDRGQGNANMTPLGQKAHEADVKDAIDEKAKDGEEEKRTKNREKRDKSTRHRDDDGERRRRHTSRSRSRDRGRERRHRHRDRSRSRDRRRDDDREHRHRHRSRSREHRRREDRPERRRDRGTDDKRSRSRSRDRRRRRHTRSRSPYERYERSER